MAGTFRFGGGGGLDAPLGDLQSSSADFRDGGGHSRSDGSGESGGASMRGRGGGRATPRRAAARAATAMPSAMARNSWASSPEAAANCSVASAAAARHCAAAARVACARRVTASDASKRSFVRDKGSSTVLSSVSVAVASTSTSVPRLNTRPVGSITWSNLRVFSASDSSPSEDWASRNSASTNSGHLRDVFMAFGWRACRADRAQSTTIAGGNRPAVSNRKSRAKCSTPSNGTHSVDSWQ